MKKIPSKLEVLFVALALIGLGLSVILTGVIPAYRGRWGNTPAFPVTEPYVPVVGVILVVGGMYVLVRFIRALKKK